ncbi:MAG: ATP-binding cassette domain-containing protein [Chloroflexi bacterium]|nr:ATP-binding cassette domain-containing protein [Chloroflexota bacterium]MCL5273992.1 ATP-binding cassette domain-containing protein [Chloroflexota bacterium]
MTLSYTYPNAGQPALERVSFEIQAGAFALVIGESGSGKSTLLRCFNGLVPHFTGGSISGSLSVDGLNPVVAGPSSMARHVGMVFQDPESQFVLDRVEDEIAFALENAAMPRAEMRARVDEALRRMDIERLRFRQISTLSGGEQQRVAIAAALVLRPRILALDEPTSQLDPQAADEVMDALSTLNHTYGLTIVLAEHRIERVLQWAHQVLLVQAGRVVSGEPADVLAQTELVPPVVSLARQLNLSPLPLTVHEMRERLQGRFIPAAAPHPDQPEVTVERKPVLSISDLTAHYGERQVLDAISLVVRPGEVVALMGSNGVGKSTLLKSIVGLLKTTSGQISVNGQSVIGRDTWDICKDVAYLPQNPNALLFADTVSAELETTLANHGLTGSKDTGALLDRLGLRRYAQAYPRDLSVGERERVAIGAVTVTEPKLVLLDEPTRGLDYGSKRALAALLRHWKEAAIGILLVTHDVEFVAECADRVVMLADGRISADGPTHQVLRGAAIFEPQIVQLFPEMGWLTAGQVAGRIQE